MAQRRMFSLKVIDSAKFLKMPASTQLLYFHLALRADDDGVVEGYNVMRMLGCSEDDLKILVAKGFIVVLNEDLVTFITDWKEHNLIRADRKIDSIYKDLLLQVVSDVKLLEAKPRADSKLKNFNEIIENGRPVDNQMTDEGQPNDENGQHRLGKVRLGKDSIGKDKKEKSKSNFDVLIEQYTDNDILKNTIYDFIKMRKAIKAAMTDNALKLTLSKLDKLGNDDETKIKILEQSIMNSWKGIFELKEDRHGSVRQNTKPNSSEFYDFSKIGS